MVIWWSLPTLSLLFVIQLLAFTLKYSCSPQQVASENATSFDPLAAAACIRQSPRFVHIDGTPVTSGGPLIISAEDALAPNVDIDLMNLQLRDPNYFVSKQLGVNLHQWEPLFQHCDPETAVLVRGWLSNGVDIGSFLKSYCGTFKGTHYDMSAPDNFYQGNSSSCDKNQQVVARTLEERISNGSLKLLGRWDQLSERELPACIMPLTLDPKKDRVCHDERFLNLFIKDSPFRLDTLRDVPRIVQENDLLVNTDEKSGYDHVALSEDSMRYFGLMYDGWVMCYTTLPFGFKAACYIYQTIGMLVSSYLRNLGMPILQYIDDRLIVASSKLKGVTPDHSLYAVLQLMHRLGYTFSLAKCCFTPTTQIRFLGFVVDSASRSFSLPEDKKVEFCDLLSAFLTRDNLSLRMLQQLSGKCGSMAVAIPGATFFMREMNNSISAAQRSGQPVPLAGPLRQELQHWEFLRSWDGVSKWKQERHLVVDLATDASGYKWAGKLLKDLGPATVISDYFASEDDRPIHIKEAEALIFTLQALGDEIKHHRVDVLTDSMALIGAWNRQGSKSASFNTCLKQLFATTITLDLDVQLKYINTKVNPADAPSRALSKKDAHLAGAYWRILDDMFGPHTCDLMALDSNAMVSRDGTVLKHFTPHPTPGSSGENVFTQAVGQEKNPYAFPPIAMISPLLCLLEEQKVKVCTMVVPSRVHKESWWPKILQFAIKVHKIASQSETAVLWYPTKTGYSLDLDGLPWDLYAFKLSFA